MGIDLLDLSFRIECEFKIKLAHDDIMELLNSGNTTNPPKGAWTDIQVCSYVACVEAAIRAQHSTSYADTYDRVKKHIIDCLGVDESEVHSEAWMARDLGME